MIKITLTLLYSLITLTLAAQTPITLSESTFKMGGLEEKEFYFGFCEGDELIFDFKETNGKELQEIEISEYPATSKYSEFQTSKIENYRLKVSKTGIYKLRLLNSALRKRVCKYKIQRIPSSEETISFNSNVLWKTNNDTIYTAVQEKYLVRSEYKPITIVPIAEYYVNSGSNAMFKGGKSRITFPVNLPNNTIEWYYVFSAAREEEDIKEARSTLI